MSIDTIREALEYALTVRPQMVMDGSAKVGSANAVDYNYRSAIRQSLADLSTIDPEAICAESLRLAEKQSQEWFSYVSNDYDHDAPRWAHNLAAEQKAERAAILADEPHESEKEEGVWRTELPLSEGLYLVEVSTNFSAHDSWYETAFYRPRDGWTLPKGNEGETVIAWTDIPRRAEVERRIKEVRP